MARRPLRQLVRDARQAEQLRHADDLDSHEGWLVAGLKASPDRYTRASRLNFDRDNRTLAINFDFPTIEAVDDVPLDQRRQTYLRFLAEMTLRCVHHCLAEDVIGAIEAISFDGYVDTVDLATGQEIRPRLVHAHFARAQFDQLDLTRVDALACLKGLDAQITLDSTESEFWAI